MDNLSIEDKVAFLSTPAAYPGDASHVEIKQTHMSWVFLTEKHAWKLKKPVHYDYLDFSTVEARRRHCEQEVVLNRRLAANVYLGVVPLTMQSGHLMLGGSGTPVDWLVHMRRLPDEMMLDQAIEHRTWHDEDLRKVGILLGRFYKASAPVEHDGAQYRRRLVEELHKTCLELQRPEYGLPLELVNTVSQKSAEFIQENSALLDDRVRSGKVIDAHGDLRAEHVCLEEEPVVIDCLEFSAALRVLDSASELAFLKLECERLGAVEVGERILETSFAEAGDHPQVELLAFYKTFHAAVRAKVALWHLRDVPDDRAKWVERATTYLRLARS